MIPILLAFVFWFSIALILYTYVGYPLIIGLISRFFPIPKRDLFYEPTVSMLIAAYNEEQEIERKIRDTLALDYPPDKLEIVIVSDGSTDRTDEIVQSLAPIAGPRLQFYRKPRGGKTAALNLGIPKCKGEIIVFSDVTSHYEAGAIRELVSYHITPGVAGVTGICRFHDASKEPVGPGLGQRMYGGYEQSIRVFQSRIRTTTASAGPIHSVRRSLYAPLPDDACMDMMLPIALVRRGYRVLCAPGANAHEYATRSVRQEYRMRVRVASHGVKGLLDAVDLLGCSRGPWIALQLFSHKLLRYLLPLFLLALLVSNACMIPFFWWARYAFLAQAAFYGTALIALYLPEHRVHKVLTLPLYFCIGNSALLVSVLDFCRGNKYVLWNTERA